MHCNLLSTSYFLWISLAALQSLLAQHPIFPPEQSDRRSLLSATQEVRALSHTALRDLVPIQSGLNYVGCPNCRNGRQENQLAWSFSQPDQVKCQYCEHAYPSPQYPTREKLSVRTPDGQRAEYPYWQNADGYRYFFQAKIDDERRRFMARQAHLLAQLYHVTKEVDHALRAALIIERFAEVFPSWCYHYDYPHRQKEIYDGAVAPGQFRSGYRTARWTWWAYSDIPIELLHAYDLISNGQVWTQLSTDRGYDVAERIERDLFRAACDQVLANPETHSNMSPRAWLGLVVAGRVLPEPLYVHAVKERLSQFVDKRFFYDGVWCEGSPDYGWQSLHGIRNVLDALKGHSDPPGYRHPQTGERLENLELSKTLPALATVRLALERWRLPNGRSVPVHDTWPTSIRRGTVTAGSYILPAVGHACLMLGDDPQRCETHITWSGGYGHSHGDNLSLLLFHRGEELLSDLGYTHSAYRAWTLATAAHNTVVIDGHNQSLGRDEAPTDGRLLDIDFSQPSVQFVSADGARGYPGLAQLYQRTCLLLRTPAGHPYVVDRFDVQGGRQHDYFLHGSADAAFHLQCDKSLQARGSLHPTPESWQAPVHEGQTGLIAQPYYAYGFLKQLRSTELTAGNSTVIDWHDGTPEAHHKLRTHLLTHDPLELVVGVNPSIRQAAENDARLDDFHRPFMMLRHSAHDNSTTSAAAEPLSSRFVTVLETIAGQAEIERVELLPDPQATILKVEFKSNAVQPSTSPQVRRVDWIILNATKQVSIATESDALQFEGPLGYLMLENDQIRWAYARGTARWLHNGQVLCSGQQLQTDLLAFDKQGLLLPADSPLPQPGALTLLKTTDQWVYPFTVKEVVKEVVAASESTRVHVAEIPAFEYTGEQAKLRGLMFPQREHAGPVRVEWSTAGIFQAP